MKIAKMAAQWETTAKSTMSRALSFAMPLILYPWRMEKLRVTRG